MASSSSPAAKAEIINALQTILESTAEASVPGLSAAISTSKGLIWQGSAGFENLTNLSPITIGSTFGMGSITKIFVAVVVLQLVDEKRLQASDKVEQHLDEDVYKGIGNAKEATIEALLSHTSGIESWEDDPKWILEGRGKDVDVKRIWGKVDTLDYIRHPSALTPGIFSYANTNFTLLGLIIEKITGEPAEKEIRHRILDHLSMESTFLEGFEELASSQQKLPRRYHYATAAFREAAGISPAFKEISWAGTDFIDATPSNMSTEWVAGGMVSSPSDLLKFAVALRDGELLSLSSLGFMHAWTPVGRYEYRIGHNIVQWRNSHGVWLGHNGSVLGFTGTLWWLDQDADSENDATDCAVCVLANVGTMHTDTVKAGAQAVLETDFLDLAKKLSKLA